MLSKCIACGHTDYQQIRDHVRHNIKIPVYRCMHCGLENLDSPPINYNEEYRTLYTPEYGKEFTPAELHETYLKMQGYKIHSINNEYQLEKNQEILDVGCATGYLVERLRPFVKHAYGFEVREDDVAFAQQRGLDVFDEWDDVPVVDRITCTHVLEHVTTPEHLLIHMFEHLKPNGHLYLSVPNRNDAMLTVYESEPYAEWWYEEPHRWYFTPEALRLLIERVGFRGKVVYQQRVNVLNHMHWMFTSEQQVKELQRTGPPIVCGDHRVNTCWCQIDAAYKKTLEQHGLTDNMIYSATR